MRLSVSPAARSGRAHAYRLAAAVLAFGLVACSSSDVTGPTVTPTASLTVDANAKNAYVHLAEQPALVTTADTASSTGWDISFNSTSVAINSAGGVTAYCLCSNEAATDAQVMAFTAEAQLSAFDAVTSADIPSTGFDADVLSTHKWYRYNLTGEDHQIWPVFNVYLIKRGSTVYKVQIINYYGADGAVRQITFRSAILGS